MLFREIQIWTLLKTSRSRCFLKRFTKKIVRRMTERPAVWERRTQLIRADQIVSKGRTSSDLLQRARDGKQDEALHRFFSWYSHQ